MTSLSFFCSESACCVFSFFTSLGSSLMSFFFSLGLKVPSRLEIASDFTLAKSILYMTQVKREVLLTYHGLRKEDITL